MNSYKSQLSFVKAQTTRYKDGNKALHREVQDLSYNLAGAQDEIDNIRENITHFFNAFKALTAVQTSGINSAYKASPLDHFSATLVVGLQNSAAAWQQAWAISMGWEDWADTSFATRILSMERKDLGA